MTPINTLKLLGPANNEKIFLEKKLMNPNLKVNTSNDFELAFTQFDLLKKGNNGKKAQKT